MRFEVGNPLEWSAAGRCTVLNLVSVAFLLEYWLAGTYVLQHPEIAPFLDFDFVARVQPLLAACIVYFALLAAWGLWARVHHPSDDSLQYTTLLSYGAYNAVACVVLGAVSTPSCTVLLCAAWGAFLAFDRAKAWAYTGSAAVILLAGIAGQLAGFIPYAPLFREAPFAHGHIHIWWVVETLFATLGISGLSILSFAFVMRKLQEREQMLVALSTTDELTRVSNRRHVLAAMDAEYKRFERLNVPFSCLLIDIDRFKQVNDLFGHQAGDQLLAAVARVLQNPLREIDMLGRYGGEEFLVILPATTLENAHFAAERVRRSVRGIRLTSEPGLRVSVSIGVAQSLATGDMQGMLRRADLALYEAKRAGRNRVVCAPQTAAPQPLNERALRNV